MLSIGIEKHKNLVYEADGNHGHAIWPSPLLIPAKIAFESEGVLVAEKSNANIKNYIFREDYYDPTSRIKRGRFYMAGNSLHQQWWVQPHPARPLEIQKASNHGIETTLETYQSISFYYQFLNKKTEQPLVLLGLDESFSIWTVIARERMYNGEELITLKSRNSLGILPIINDKKILDEFRASVKDSIEGFVDDVYRATPISLIHRARDVACHILLAYFELKGNTVLELAPLAEKLEKEEKKIIGASAAKIIARLHSRAKPNEQEKHSLPQIREQDAQLAVQCVGTILCEIGWAKWQ